MRYLLLVLFAATPAVSQERFYADVKTRDGSSLRAAILEKSLVVKTRYGELTIPVADIRKIELGHRLPVGTVAAIDKNVRDLGHADYSVRDQASRELIKAGRWAYAKVCEARMSDDMEVARRATVVAATIAKAVPEDQLVFRTADKIYTSAFHVVGRIVADKLQTESLFAGSLEMPLCSLDEISMRTFSTSVLVSASKCGLVSSRDWLDTGAVGDTCMILTATATGAVDLYPVEPWQYKCGPNGSGSHGRDTDLPAGALVGKFGESGRPFVIGSNYRGLVSGNGNLFLIVVQSSWNNGMNGGYDVTFKIAHAE